MKTLEATLTEPKRAGIRSRRALRVTLGALALILGLACLALGGVVFASAHDTHPVEIDGTIADYHEITINGAYARNELRLTNDPHIYTFDSRQFHPALPQRFQKGTRIQIWADQGTNNVLAITLYDELGINPTSYTTSAYDNPTLAFATTEGEAGALAVMGAALMIAGGLSLLFRRKRRVGAQSGRARVAPQPAPVAFGPARPVATLSSPSQDMPAPLPTAPFVAPGVNATGTPAIPLSQAAPTTPAPNRLSRPTNNLDLDQVPTQKSPAISPEIAHPQASAPPGSLPDFPTEHMPAPLGAAPPDDVSDQPTRKSETATPPDMGRQ